MQKIPIVLYNQAYWNQVINFRFLADEGTVHESDLDLFSYAETPQQAWDTILRFHAGNPDAAV
jgi:predicted Rossmann-fold nucleotide-binding protein